MITEVYVSIDNLEFTKLDLFKDEAINIKKTQKDLQDISKIFSPYSLNFSFKATPKNRQAFGFFGDTKVIKVNTENKFYCKIYTNGMLTLNGFLQLSSITYKNNTAENFIGSFNTSLTDLKTRMGEDAINDLATLPISWSPKKVFTLMQSPENQTIEGINVSYFVPLISNLRVWSYDESNTLLDNVKYNAGYLPTDINLIQPVELRPCISFSSVIDFIIKKYELNINCPLFSRSEYKDLVIYANNEKISNNLEKKLKIISPFGGYQWDNTESSLPSNYDISTDLTDSTFHLTLLSPPVFPPPLLTYRAFCRFSVFIQGVTTTSATSVAPTVIIRLKKKITDEVFKVKSFGLTGLDFNCIIDIENSFFTSNVLDFYITAEFNTPVIWNNTLYKMLGRYTFDPPGPVIAVNLVSKTSSPNNNSLDFGADQIDLFKMLPATKNAEFLSSFFKIFNISVYEDSINTEKLNWLTPADVQTSGLSYSKARLDYTPYTNIDSVTKSSASDFNYFDFKHVKSKYKSNTDYLEQTGLEYGQATYPLIKPNKTVPFTVQDSFSIIPPVHLVGSTIPTFYGFTKDNPTILTGGQSRYKPNFNELTLFYNHGIKPLGVTLGVQSQNISGSLINAQLNNFVKVMPFSKNNNSLAWSDIVFDSIEYVDSLFLFYYANQIVRLLNPNALSQTYTLNLPSAEIYVNEATTIQGQGLVPIGFRLQNEIIIGETLFTIIDSNIDITTGKTKLTLLNF
jgi:hypothetical protein